LAKVATKQTSIASFDLHFLQKMPKKSAGAAAAAAASSKGPAKTSCLVTGGCGFLGRYIAEQLADKGYAVTIFDRIQSFSDSRFTFVVGDLCSPSEVVAATVGMNTVFHVAAVIASGSNEDLVRKVNVGGTQNVIDACIENGVKRLIFTSTASVVFSGSDVVYADETHPIPTRFMDSYAESKSTAERLVLAANGRGVLLTCSIRPHAIFGPRDPTFFPAIIANARKPFFMRIGDGRNISDFTYVENAAYAHILAMERLVPGSPVAGAAYFITNGEPIACVRLAVTSRVRWADGTAGCGSSSCA
jgi:sterol-4alpha-carboxylate 3-dehydrogenase (decarboxylating)